VDPKKKKAPTKASAKTLVHQASDKTLIQDKLGDGKWAKDPIFISSWNVNGIRATMKKGDLQNYLKKASPDIICINELKID